MIEKEGSTSRIFPHSFTHGVIVSNLRPIPRYCFLTSMATFDIVDGSIFASFTQLINFTSPVQLKAHRVQINPCSRRLCHVFAEYNLEHIPRDGTHVEARISKRNSKTCAGTTHPVLDGHERTDPFQCLKPMAHILGHKSCSKIT
jgi:hypothetical protein